MKGARIVFCVFALVGLLLFFIGYWGSENNAAFFDAAEKTQGIFTKVDAYHEQSAILYRAGRQTFQPRLSLYSSAMRQGAEVTVYYEKEHPENFRTEYHNLPFFILRIIGGSFLGVAAVTLLALLCAGSRRRRLMNNGLRVTLPIESVRENRHMRINGRHPYRLFCVYEDPHSGRHWEMKSRNLPKDPSPLLVRQEVDVYLDPKNPGNYVVDDESALR